MQAMLLTMNFYVILYTFHFLWFRKKRKHVFDNKWGKCDGYSDHQTLSESSVVHDLKFSFL